MSTTSHTPQSPLDTLYTGQDAGETIEANHTKDPAQGVNALAAWTVANQAKVFSVVDYGAVGDGTTDDSTAVQDAFDAAGAATVGAVVLFPAGRNYKITGSGITLTRSGPTVPMWVFGYGSKILYTGTGSLFTWAGSGAHPTHGGWHFRGLHLDGNSTGQHAFNMRDCINSTWRDIVAVEWDSATDAAVFRILNYAAWSENCSFQRIWGSAISRMTSYLDLSTTGSGGGTNSFARQRWEDVFCDGGSDCLFFFDDEASVYGSWFNRIGGNTSLDLASGEAVFSLGGGMGGTRFLNIDFEGTGSIFNPARIATNAPTALESVTVRSPMQLVPTGASETKLGRWQSGTWTPTVTQSGSVTVTVNSARYSRQGTVAEVWANLTVTGSGTASNEIIVGGFPGTPSITSIVVGNGALGDVSPNPDIIEPFELRLTSTTQMKLRSTRDNTDVSLGASGAVFADGLASGDTIRFHARYPITVD